MQISDFIVKVIDQGNSIVAKKGTQQRVYSKEQLTRSWLTMSNDSFFRAFGFNWVPPIDLQNRIKKELWREAFKNEGHHYTPTMGNAHRPW